MKVLVIPTKILNRKDLNSTDKLVWGYFAANQDHTAMQAAENMQIGRKSIGVSCSKLSQLGLMKKVRHYGYVEYISL